MKRLLIVPAVLIALVLGLGVRKSLAGPSYPASLDVSGYGNYHSGLIQPVNPNWTVTFSWDSTLPSNQSADVMVVNQNGTIKDNKLTGPTSGGGSVTLNESGNSPVYFLVNAGNWHIVVQ